VYNRHPTIPRVYNRHPTIPRVYHTGVIPRVYNTGVIPRVYLRVWYTRVCDRDTSIHHPGM